MSVRTMARVWELSKASGTELLMLLAIADFADDDGNAYPAVATLARKCRMQPRNAQVLLRALTERGELRVRMNKGPRGANRYCITLAAGVQDVAGVQSAAGVQDSAQRGAKPCAEPLQGNAPEPSLNRHEPPFGDAAVAARPKRDSSKGSRIQQPAVDTSDAWAAYQAAYIAAYSTTPIRKPKDEADMAKIVRTLGTEAGAVAAFYVRHPWTEYRTQCHRVSLLIRDADLLLAQFKSGTVAPDPKETFHERKGRVIAADMQKRHPYMLGKTGAELFSEPIPDFTGETVEADGRWRDDDEVLAAVPAGLLGRVPPR